MFVEVKPTFSWDVFGGICETFKNLKKHEYAKFLLKCLRNKFGKTEPFVEDADSVSVEVLLISEK